MSRSLKKIAAGKVCKVNSDKQWKKLCHRSFRRISKVKLLDYENFQNPLVKECSDVWNSPSDGKSTFYYSVKEVEKDIMSGIAQSLNCGEPSPYSFTASTYKMFIKWLREQGKPEFSLGWLTPDYLSISDIKKFAKYYFKTVHKK